MKVRDVLSMIGDKPLIEVLNERGYTVLGDDDEDDAIDFLEQRGHCIDDSGGEMERGWFLWRNQSPLFPEWLRQHFWTVLGRGD